MRDFCDSKRHGRLGTQLTIFLRKLSQALVAKRLPLDADPPVECSREVRWMLAKLHRFFATTADNAHPSPPEEHDQPLFTTVPAKRAPVGF